MHLVWGMDQWQTVVNRGKTCDVDGDLDQVSDCQFYTKNTAPCC